MANRSLPTLWRYLPLAALMVLAVYPIFSGGLPTTGDGLNHFYRLAELAWQVRHGDWYPRWFANLGYGFGMPVLNFYSPLSYYIALALHGLGLTLAAALQFSYGLALIAAIGGAYVWGRALFKNDWAAFLTAAAYGLAPYFYFNIFHRGAYPETWALALMPWIGWALHRAVTQTVGAKSYGALAALAAALVLLHTLSALIFAPLAVIYALTLLGLQPKDAPKGPRFAGLVGAGVLALILVAFFVLPLLAESQFIQLQRTYSTGDLDYHNNFLTLSGLFSAPPNFDPHLVFNAMPASLGWLQAGLAVLGLILTLVQFNRQQERNWGVILVAVLLVLVSFLTLSIAEPIWNVLNNVLRFIQFPWRLVGPASLLAALLAGAVLAQARLERWAAWIVGLACLGFFFFSLPWTYHDTFATPPYQSPDDSIQYEIHSGELGTSSTAEYLPKWVETLPDSQTYSGTFANDALYSRLQPLPETVKFSVSKDSVNAETLTYESPNVLPITYNLFYFPGWVATLDGQPIELEPQAQTGLIALTAPAGAHSLALSRQLTQPELTGTLVSALGLLFWLGLVLFPLPNVEAVQSEPESRPIPALALGVLCLALLIARGVYFDQTETVFHHTNPIPNATAVNFGNALELIGAEQPATLSAEEAAPIVLYWRASQPLTADYSASVQLADSLGNRFGQADSQHPNGVPTSRWRLDQYARDVHSLMPLAGTPPGTYKLLVTVYAGAQPLSVIQDGAPSGIEYELGQVQVTAPKPQGSGSLKLETVSVANQTVAVGDQLALTAVWFTGDAPAPDLKAQLMLVDESGETIFQSDQMPVGPDYPSQQWVPDTLVRYPLSVTLPPNLPAGKVQLKVGLVNGQGAVAAGPYEAGPLTITVPERTFTIPTMQVTVNHDFGDSIRLLGYDRGSDSITLYWQSLKTISPRLTVFVHTLNDAGDLINGNDAAPERPTTGWLPGEVIADTHPLAVGDHFEVGLYDPITNVRFGETFVTSP